MTEASHKTLFSDKRGYCIWFSIISVLGIIGCLLVWNFSIDDAYIQHRFGQRLCVYGNLAWNIGEVPVEGYTSFFSVLLSAMFIKASIDLLIGFKVLNIILMLLTAHLIYLSTGFFAEDIKPAYRMIFPALFVLSPLTWIHCMSGMETLLFTSVLIFQCYLYLRLRSGGFEAGRTALLAIMCLVSGMVRPEGALWSALACLSLLFHWKKREPVWLILLFFIVPGCIYMIWRWGYFHFPLPNTFYVKGDALLKGKIVSPQVIVQVLAFFFGFWFLHVWAIFDKTGNDTAFRKDAILLSRHLVYAALLCILYFSTARMLMGYAIRFTYPFYQVLLVVLCVPVFVAIRKATGPQFLAARVRKVVLVASLVLLLGLNVAGGVRATPTVLANSLTSTNYKEIGNALQRVAETHPGHRFSVYHHNMGELMFYAISWNTLDAVGLLDSHIAHKGLDADYVFSKLPDLLILPSKDDDILTRYSAEMRPDVSWFLVTDSRFAANYSYIGRLRRMRSSTAMFFFLSKRAISVDPEIEGQLSTSIGLDRGKYLIEK